MSDGKLSDLQKQVDDTDPLRMHFASLVEQENAALRRLVDAFTGSSNAVENCEKKLKDLGCRLGNLARAFQLKAMGATDTTWDNYAFMVTDHSFTVSHPNWADGSTTFRPCDFDWNAMCELLRGYSAACRDRQEAASQLTAMGIPIKGLKPFE